MCLETKILSLSKLNERTNENIKIKKFLREIRLKQTFQCVLIIN